MVKLKGDHAIRSLVQSVAHRTLMLNVCHSDALFPL